MRNKWGAKVHFVIVYKDTIQLQYLSNTEITKRVPLDIADKCLQNYKSKQIKSFGDVFLIQIDTHNVERFGVSFKNTIWISVTKFNCINCFIQHMTRICPW